MTVMPIEVTKMEKEYMNEFIKYLLSITQTELIQPED